MLNPQNCTRFFIIFTTFWHFRVTFFKKYLIFAKKCVIMFELINEMWLSLVERCVRDAEVAGSNPVISTRVAHDREQS